MKDPLEDFNKAAQKTVDEQNAATPTQEEEIVAETPAEEVVQEEIVKEEEVAEEVLETTEEVVDESEPKEDDTTVEQEAVKDGAEQESDVISDWDTPSEEATKSTEFDFTSLASEVGFEADSKEAFLRQIEEVKAKAETPDVIATLPETLQKAIEIASQDGNYLDFLKVTSVNYDAVANLDIVTAHFNQLFTNANGMVDADSVELNMDSLTDAQIEAKGMELKAQYKGQQDQRASAIEAETTQNRAEADKQLKSVLDGLTEHRGFKYSPSHKKQLYDGITTGNMIAEMFHGNDGKMDMTKVVNSYSDFKFGEQQNKYLRQQIETKATKKVLDRISNKSIETKSGLPHREVSEPKDAAGKVAADVRERGAEAFRPRV
jgi:hypothetical protein